MTGGCGARRADESGLTLVELLVAAAVTMLVLGAVAGTVLPMQRVYDAQLEAAEFQQGLRVAAQTVKTDLLAAGAGLRSVGRPPLGRFVPPVFPSVAIETAGGARVVRSDAITLMSVDDDAFEGRLVAPLDPGGIEIALEPETITCVGPTGGTCRPARDDRIVVLDIDGRWDLYQAGAVNGGSVSIDRRTSDTRHARGAVVVRTTLVSYTVSAADVPRLSRRMPWGSAQPVVDNVVALTFAYYGEAAPPHLIANADGSLRASYGPDPPPLGIVSGMWPAGENCTFAVMDDRQVSRLAVLGGSADVRLPDALFGDGPWCPDAAAALRFDADLLRIRRVEATVRVQASPSFRGPAGLLFTNGGTARDPRRLLPDREMRVEVALRSTSAP